MLQIERYHHIVSELEKHGSISIKNLMNVVSPSRSTIRRDLLELEKMHKLVRTRGGAVAVGNNTDFMREFEYRKNQQHEEKLRIAHAALQFVNEQEAILIDEGSTSFELAKLLGRFRSLTVATCSLNIAWELRCAENIELLVIGGMMKRKSLSMSGSIAEQTVRGISSNRFFMTADGVNAEQGCMCYGAEEATVKRSMIKSVKETILLVDHTKFNKNALINICELKDLNTIVTGKEADRKIVSRIQSLGINIVLA
ncbi:MAG: DeoR/GlpR family DNA-binding transcription regulator [Clostridiales Family XIII bacterium]|nr:DeoR/GlpR family DNA-binding transcription regulator [Clostridiales Family XIII bacterium]